MKLPNRIADLMSKLEAGLPVTQQDLNRTAALQALDFAQCGRDFVNEVNEREQQQVQFLTQQVQAS